MSLGFAGAFAQVQKSNVVDEVIWVVGDEPILRSDVEEARISAELYGEHIDNPYCVIPEQLAIQKLFLHQAALGSVEVDGHASSVQPTSRLTASSRISVRARMSKPLHASRLPNIANSRKPCTVTT